MAVVPARPTLARSWSDFLYVATGAPLGFAWALALGILLVAGVALSWLVVGLPLLAFTMLLWRFGANTERARAALVLGAPISRPPRAAGDTVGARWKSRFRDRRTWRDLGYMLLLAPVGMLAGTLLVGLWAAALAALLAPLVAPGAPAGSLLDQLNWLELGLLPLAGVLLGVVALAGGRVLALGCGALAVMLLAPDDRGALTKRISTLEESRSGAVESADARLRRLERDLHDGAQHRLAYIALELGRARRKLQTDPEEADALLAVAHDESKRAMRELRDLVRGVHPSVLTDRGLDAALSGLAQRASLPVEINARLDGRLPTAVETAAYYVVAEALTNAGRHSGASHAWVELERADGLLCVDVGDDGDGGAERRPGSGLDGLAQRVEALDGRFAVVSPAGGPTLIRAELPCES